MLCRGRPHGYNSPRFHNYCETNSVLCIKRAWFPLTLCLGLLVALPGYSDDGAETPPGVSKAGAKTRPTLTFEAPPPKTIDVSGLTEKQQASLVKRVTEKWRAMERRDFAATYEYTTPSYRKVFSRRMYLNRFAYDIRWELTGVEILNYDSEAAVASVAVRVMSGPAKQTTPASGFGNIANTVMEKWFFIDGEWWNNAK